ncbi:hypothetical protein PFICI_07840 [Pestalotiopsis fici W106-1]|uniref:Rho-GAP domain-containing protein n=1 Tax=Pestalotiopsis fici (strain W106-1 / CGMCC3.15140) TaxID=1229662 RepID=W3X559_PESFW|nr:uncharacterized protein PFICI_07840 [Pestalotiopsis fici W106-1]ETS80311.1 hypothetical protein PFICI_07840 [Pestalotiopsis fici W106-1]
MAQLEKSKDHPVEHPSSANDIIETDPDSSHKQRQRRLRLSNTWSSSSANIDFISKEEEVNDYGIRSLVPGDFPLKSNTSQSLPNRKSSWMSRVLHQGSTTHPERPLIDMPNQILRHRRTISDLAVNFVQHQRKEGLKNENLRDLVRLCGKSMFYLPQEYAYGSLILPTCLRATAQYLVQHAQTSGIFRVPGSVRVVNALYDYYCAGIDGEEVRTTTHCPSLPSHLNCGVHDVASTFKRLLSGLPGGILGSLALFDALVAVHSQLHNTVEANRTKETKLRARLIALAICTVRSQYQRELICAVFGLLCLVGRTAENAPREDEYGQPLPTSDLMGYNALAIIFGPLLVGDLLSSYSMKLADPVSGLVILPITQSKLGKHRKLKVMRKEKPGMLAVDRIIVANDITEMMLVHWRDVVRHLANLKAHKREQATTNTADTNGALRETQSQTDEPSHVKSDGLPKGEMERSLSQRSKSQAPRRMSTPPAAHSTSYSGLGISETHFGDSGQDDKLQLKRRRSRPPSSVSFRQLSGGHPMSPLSPTMEEAPIPEQPETQSQSKQEGTLDQASNKPKSENQQENTADTMGGSLSASYKSPSQPADSSRGSLPVPSTLRPPTQQSTKHDLEYTELKVDTRRITENMLTESSMSLGTIRRHTPSTSVPETHIKEQYPSHMDDSTAGHTPLLRAQKLPMQESKSVRVVAFDESSSRGGVSPSPLGMHRLKGQENVESRSIQHRNISTRSHENTQAEAISSNGSPEPSFGRTKWPSYMPSAVNPLRTPPLYKAEFLPPAENSRTQHTNEQQTNPARDSSPTTRWKELVRDSPTSSPAEIKSKRMARGSRQSLTRESGESRAREDPSSSLTPDWKRQLLMKRRGREQSEQDCTAPRWPTGVDKMPPEDGLAESSHSTKGDAPSLLNVTASASSSRRSASKPVNGTVKAIAARFDSVSQESSPSQQRSTLRGSHSFVSADTETQNQKPAAKTTIHSDSTKSLETPSFSLSNQGLKRVKSTPARFRASISRLSQGLRSTPALAKYVEFPSPSKPTTIPEVEISTSKDADEEFPATPSRVPQLQVQPARVLSPNAMAAPQDGLPRRRRSNMTVHSPEAFGRGNVVENGNDGGSHAARQLRRSNSDTSSILHHQIRILHSQLNVRNEHIHGLRRDLDAMYGTDVGVLSQQLRRSRRECQMWKDRALEAEKRLAVFERFSAKFKGLKGDIDDTANSVGARSSICSHGNPRRGLSQSSHCSTHAERPGTSSTCHHHEKDCIGGGSDGVDSPEVYENYISKYLDDTQARTRQCNISKAQSELWIAAERLLGVPGVMNEH